MPLRGARGPLLRLSAAAAPRCAVRPEPGRACWPTAPIQPTRGDSVMSDATSTGDRVKATSIEKAACDRVTSLCALAGQPPVTVELCKRATGAAKYLHRTDTVRLGRSQYRGPAQLGQRLGDAHPAGRPTASTRPTPPAWRASAGNTAANHSSGQQAQCRTPSHRTDIVVADPERQDTHHFSFARDCGRRCQVPTAIRSARRPEPGLRC